MNQESSRSHGIFTAIIRMIQTLDSGESHVKTSRFHIVDLAGSERIKDTGAEGMRVKEAGMINKSLTVLGQVIYDLSDNSSSNLNDTLAKKSKYIRYRESKLTYLLKDALGGNSKTVMICNVNPHIDAMKETRSTLQFAQRAKLIKCEARVNEENTSAQYWKDKFLALQRQNTGGAGGNVTKQAPSTNSCVDSALCSKCSMGSKLDQNHRLDNQAVRGMA